MKRALLTLSGALFFAVNLPAQVTLNSSDYATSGLVGTSDRVLLTATAPVYPTLTPATNATWDMTGATSNTSVSYINHVTASSAFSAQFADSLEYSFSSFLYFANAQRSVTANAYSEAGEYVPRTAYHITAQGAQPTDSLIIDDQNIVYSTPATIISLPATLGTKWTSNYQYDFNFELTLSAFSYNHAPGIVRAFVTETDSVVGWGKMKVKDINGSPSGYMDVLQVQTVASITDSFYINGVVPPSILLTLFGVSEGQVTTDYQQSYYRTGELTPLANISFTDGTYSSPTGAETHAERLAPSSVSNVVSQEGISIYPNPIADRVINIKMEHPFNGNWTYELINIGGNIVSSDQLQPNGGNARIAVPSQLATGIYYLRLNNNGVPFSTKAIDILK